MLKIYQGLKKASAQTFIFKLTIHTFHVIFI